jgi:hypothetical protein
VRFGTSLFLIAVGAVLDFLVKVPGVHLHTIGLIVMIVGAVGLALSLTFWTPWGEADARPTTTRVNPHTTGGHGSRVAGASDATRHEEE